MIAEILLVLAGHQSSLFPTDHTLQPSFATLLHPGEKECIEALGLIAFRYRRIKDSCRKLSFSSSRYISALSSALRDILRDEYEALVVQTEARVLNRDPSLVASGSFVPLSSIRATFAIWDPPLLALVSLVEEIESEDDWKPGPLIDMLIARSQTGVYRIAEILSQLSRAVQRVWRTHLSAFVVHGTLSNVGPLASDSYVLTEGSMPSCITPQSRDAIVYIGKAIGTVKAAKWKKQLPIALAQQHTTLLESTLPEDYHAFDAVLSQIRTNVSEWLWSNVLTQKDVDDAVESLANYFLLRNGEFGLSLIREIERLKHSRLTVRSGRTSMIRDQDLDLALLRASLGTSAQHDPSLARLHFKLPSGPLRPLLPSLGSSSTIPLSLSASNALLDASLFGSNLLGTPCNLTYSIEWPLDLFLYPADLSSYGILFSYISALRKTHTRVHTCWSSLSNAQRARRKWTGLGEGGTSEDLHARHELLRCGWGVVRDMEWFLATLLGYVMTDVVDAEFTRFKKHLAQEPDSTVGLSSHSLNSLRSLGSMQIPGSTSASAVNKGHLDFTSLRVIHTTYLDRLLDGCLLTNSSLTSILRPIFDSCEQFVTQVERWGGDVLPALLFEGSLDSPEQEIGLMVKERHQVVKEMNQNLHNLLESFYEQLSSSLSPTLGGGDVSKSGAGNLSIANFTTFNASKQYKVESRFGDVRRHVERLLLKLDFNGKFSNPGAKREYLDANILAQGGLG